MHVGSMNGAGAAGSPAGTPRVRCVGQHFIDSIFRPRRWRCLVVYSLWQTFGERGGGCEPLVGPNVPPLNSPQAVT
jgi:hypothetical protein